MSVNPGGPSTTPRNPRQARFQGLDTRLLNAKGRQLVIRLSLLLRTSAIHDVRNEALQRSIDFFVQAANELVREFAPVVLQGDQDQVYLNDLRLKGDATLYSNVKALVGDLKRLGTGGLTFHSELTRNDVLSLLSVVRGFTPSTGPDEEPHLKLNEALSRAHVMSITFNRYLELGASGDVARYATRSKQTHALKTYAKILVAMRHVIGKGNDLRPMERIKLVKNVQTLIDLCHDDELYFTGMTSLKYEGEYAFFHPVHVAMISVLLGKHIGLSRKHLMDLGLAALFYDLGRVKLGPIQLEKAQSLSAEEWDSVRRHPLRSAREVLRGRSLNESVRKRLLVAFEHHLWLMEGGYPQQIVFRLPHLFSRIVAIADTYDALTTSRPHRDGFLPTEALRIMLDDAGRKYDPTLLKVLVNILQIYPLGTLVLLDSHEIGSVYHNHSDAGLRSRPILRLVVDTAGQPIDPPRVVDLSEKGPDGEFLRTIVRSVDPDDARALTHG